MVLHLRSGVLFDECWHIIDTSLAAAKVVLHGRLLVNIQCLI